MKCRFKTLGYTLINKIGEGGFGSVHKAIHIATGQVVAIKILHPNRTQNTGALTRQELRFERETSLCSQLNHPNIVSLLDKGEIDGQLFAVFPFIEGITLKQQLLSCGVLSPITVFNVMLQVLDGLAHAHDQGILHRDIKPANIMLTSKNTKTHVTILDFGISTVIDSFRDNDYINLTLTQESLGSPSYAAPEQLQGSECSTKTDLYLWGLTLVECLTGQPLVSESSIAAVFQQQLTPTPHALPPSLAQHPVCTLLRQVLHKNPALRLGNAGDLYQLLSQFDFSTLMNNVAETQSSHIPPLSKKSQSLDDTLITNRGLINANLAEKKQVTVMCIRFSHWQHSAPHSIGTDNEDIEIFEQLFQQHKDQCISIAQRYGAAQISSLGDTLLCYFGYPNVADDDCRLCAKTALEMIQSMPKHDTRERLSTYNSALHIGIHSGIVLIEHGSISEGKSIKNAMALARQAKMHQILCSDSTQQILKCHYDCEVYIADNILVEDVPFQTYILNYERRSETSRITRKKKILSSFCLRSNEFKQSKDLLTSDTTPRIMNIHGEAGIGKSWLVANLYLYCCGQTNSSTSTLTPLMVRCRSEQKHSCLQPIIGLLNNRYELDKQSLHQRIHHLSDLLSGHTMQSQTLALLCTWLGYTPLANPQTSQLAPPEAAKKHIFDALCFLLCKADPNDQQGKLIFFVEDIHYSDPVSLEFITHLVTSTAFINFGHCFYSTSRSSLAKNMDSIHTKQIALKKLNKKQSHMFLSHLFNPHPVNKVIEQIIYDLADGNPFYMQELAETLKRNKQIQLFNGEIQFNSSNHKIDIPCSLRDNLQQKLDNLAKGKNVAQIASLIGNEFDLNMLLQSTGQNKAQLQKVLYELVQSEVICCRKNAGNESYYFKHKLVRETIYASIPQILKQQTQVTISQYSHFPTYG